MTLAPWWFYRGNLNLLQLPLENIIWHVRVELYNSSLQHAKAKMSKRKLLYSMFYSLYSITALLDVSFIICLHIFLFLLELSNYVTSIVVGAIAVPFKYVGNKT